MPTIPFTSKQLAQIKQRYEAGETMQEIAPDFSVSHETIRMRLKQLGVQSRRQSPTRQDVENWCEQYKFGRSMYAIAKESPQCITTVRNFLLQEGVELRDKISILTKYTVNSQYFDSINTPEKAYWLGFIFADGYCRKEFVVQLAKKDETHLRHLRSALQSSHPIAQRQRNQVCLYIHNKYLSESLRRFPISPKSELYYPYLHYPLDSHFIRGYSDGDGGFYSYPRAKTIFCITTKNQAFMEQMHEVLLEDLEDCCNLSSSPPRRTHHGSLCLRWAGKKDVLSIYQYLYRDATVWLPRKRWKIRRTLINLFPSAFQKPSSFFQ